MGTELTDPIWRTEDERPSGTRAKEADRDLDSRYSLTIFFVKFVSD